MPLWGFVGRSLFLEVYIYLGRNSFSTCEFQQLIASCMSRFSPLEGDISEAFQKVFLFFCINSCLTSLQLSDSKWPSCVNVCFAEAEWGLIPRYCIQSFPIHPTETCPLGQLCSVLIWIPYSHSGCLYITVRSAVMSLHIRTLAQTQRTALRHTTPVLCLCHHSEEEEELWLLFLHLLNEIHSFLLFIRL